MSKSTRREFLQTAAATAAALAAAVPLRGASSTTTAPTTQPQPVTMESLGEVPAAFGRAVAIGLEGILKSQTSFGGFGSAENPSPYPHQAIFPLAFCYAGLDADRKWQGSQQVLDAIRKLGDFLVAHHSDRGEWGWDSNGFKVVGVDQRLIYAWVEGLRILREAKADIVMDAWADKIERACRELIEHRLRKIEGAQRFFARTTGTGTNHVALYISTIYRAGQVLGKKDLCDYVLPIGRALANSVHPDGYWEEHGDLLRQSGPTVSYNYLTHNGMALMREWTGDEAFVKAVDRSGRFHSNFCYPDATILDVLDERVRYSGSSSMWGLFGLSHTPDGRAAAIEHFRSLVKRSRDLTRIGGEMLARLCENQMYWHAGLIGTAPFVRPDHQAMLSLPGGIVRSGAWAIGLCAMRATTPEDPEYKDNGFALDRQKLFSLWHEKLGLVLDGSNSKNQPDNSTFHARGAYEVIDYYPIGGEIVERDGEWISRATYKTFIGEARLRRIDDKTMRITLKVEPVACRGPFNAGFTLRGLRGAVLQGAGGKRFDLADTDLALTGEDLGGSLSVGGVKIDGPAGMQVKWPVSPYNSYASNNKSGPAASVLRVFAELSFDQREVTFTVNVA